jgi:hypothetical protein
MAIQPHLFEDDEKVRIRKTGQFVTIDHWWFPVGKISVAQYNIKEHPSTWYAEYELEKIVELGIGTTSNDLKELHLMGYCSPCMFIYKGNNGQLLLEHMCEECRKITVKGSRTSSHRALTPDVDGNISVALYELDLLHKKIAPAEHSNVDRHFITIIDLLKGSDRR